MVNYKLREFAAVLRDCSARSIIWGWLIYERSRTSLSAFSWKVGQPKSTSGEVRHGCMILLYHLLFILLLLSSRKIFRQLNRLEQQSVRGRGPHFQLSAVKWCMISLSGLKLWARLVVRTFARGGEKTVKDWSKSRVVGKEFSHIRDRICHKGE